MIRKLLIVAGATAASLAVAAPAFAFDCNPANKPVGAGSVGTLNFMTGEFTPAKNNPGTEEQAHGGFVTMTDGTNSADTFVHAPQGVLPPVREGGPQYNCDGKGLDALEVCFGD